MNWNEQVSGLLCDRVCVGVGVRALSYWPREFWLDMLASFSLTMEAIFAEIHQWVVTKCTCMQKIGKL